VGISLSFLNQLTPYSIILKRKKIILHQPPRLTVTLWLESTSLSLFELWLAGGIAIDNFSFSSALLLCVEHVWLWQMLEVVDDSEDDGERNGGWRMTVWICYGGFVQVQDESDNRGIRRRWICWVNQGATMGYGILVGILRMKVLFFVL